MKDLKQLIRESINEYIRGIDEAGENAALEAKMKATTEAIELREKKMKMEGLDEAYHDMLDKGKMKELSSEIKALKKSLAKYEKTLAKLKSKGEKAEETPEEIIDEISLGENHGEDDEEERYDEEGNVDPNGMYDAGANYIGDEGKSMDKAQYDLDPMNESFLYMQKLAGIISESEYNEKIEEAKKKPSSGLTKKEKSAISKKAHAGKDIGKKGKGFEKVAKAAEKQYGSEEAGKRVAAAAMWKGAAKKAKSLKEEVQALFEDVINLTYNTDPDDLEYVKNVLKKAKISAKVKAGAFDDEVEITVDKDLREKAIAALNDAGFDI
jgi:hypothetical protein